MSYTPQWLDNLIKNYQKTVETFYINFDGLKKSKFHPSLVRKQKELIARGNELNNKILKAKQYFNTAKGWLNSLSGAFGLNALPVLPIAIVAGATTISFLAVQLRAYLLEAANIAASNEALLKAGGTPQDVINLNTNNKSLTFSDSISKIADYIAIGGTLYVIYKIMIKGENNG